MLRHNSPLGNDTSSYADSVQSSGYSIMDDASSQVSSLSRPSAKSIYLQRQEYAASVNKMVDRFQYRVEHLFTCDLDGMELRSIADCVERLKMLDGMGRVWGQSMLLEVRGSKLLLTDIETEVELESIAVNDILQLKAVLDSEVFNSLLTVSVQPRRKNTTVFIFQCEDVRADYVQRGLSQALSRSKEDSSINNAGLIAGHRGMENLRNTSRSPEPQWTTPDYEDDVSDPELFALKEEEEDPSLRPFTTGGEPPYRYTELDRDVDTLNHIVGDIEIFMGHISAVLAKNAKKKKKKKKGKEVDGMPPPAEFATCFHKIKCGLNLLGELNGKIEDPSAAEFVHSFFSTLAFVIAHCPDNLPPTIIAPLLTPQCIHLMSEEASKQEDQLWQSLGDAWNIPSTRWPDDDENIPTYTLEFFDGWQPPEVSATPEPRVPVSERETPQSAPIQTSAKWRPPQLTRNARLVESKPQRMCVMYDFTSRNSRELTVRKGEMVELLDTSKQWWKVRNSRGEEGFVPNNILDTSDEQPVEILSQQAVGPLVLTKKSKSAEVKAWLEYKGFSKITVRCLGGLSASMLLGMTREELKTVCPEEGGRVFFQLQAVKSAMAATS